MVEPSSARQAVERPGTGVADAFAHRVRIARIRIVLQASPRVLISGVIGMLIPLLAMSYDVEHKRFAFAAGPVLWAVVCGSLMANGALLRARFHRGTASDDEAVRFVRLVSLNAVAIGLVYGATSWFMIPARSFLQEAILFVSICMVLSGGAGNHAVHRPMVRGFTVSMSAMFAAGLMLHGDLLHVLLAFGYLINCAAILSYARNQEEAITRAIELSLRNEQLIKEQVAQRKEAENARAQADNARLVAEAARSLAEKADRTKTRFLAAVSHDLRQPMHALLQYIGHFKRLCQDSSFAPTVRRIEHSVDAMEDLLNAVLDFSKISIGSVKPQIEVFDVGELMRDVDMQIRPLAQAKGLDLSTSADAGFVASDRILLERIVRNLAQNAVRYTNAGKVRLRASRNGRFTRILVADSGIGIRADDKARIFEEYFQVDNFARDRRKGLGLGLAIVRDLANLLGHRVRIMSLLGGGSTFAVEIPNADASAVHEPAVAAVDSEADYVKGAIVALIDDDPMARDGLQLTLGDFGCRVLAAASASEALDLLAQSEFMPHALISDYRLADGKDGIDAIERVRSFIQRVYGDAGYLPALIISGDTAPAELTRVMGAGLEMIHKPVGIARLYGALNGALRTRMQVS